MANWVAARFQVITLISPGLLWCSLSVCPFRAIKRDEAEGGRPDEQRGFPRPPQGQDEPGKEEP